MNAPFYLGHVDAINEQTDSLPVIVIDGRKKISRSVHLGNVIEWLEGTVSLQLVYGYDVPNRDGIYICTDPEGNVRYGQVIATAANCFRFQEQYANGGVTTWYDKASAAPNTVSEKQLDMSQLSNWMLLLPTVSMNTSDHSQYSEDYMPNTAPTPCAIKSCPLDNRTQDQKNRAETDSLVDHERDAGNAQYKFYRWSANLRGDKLIDFTIGVSDFVETRKDLPQKVENIDHIPLKAWQAYAKYLIKENPEKAWLSIADIDRAKNIFFVARSCYFLQFGTKPNANAYYDTLAEKLLNGETIK